MTEICRRTITDERLALWKRHLQSGGATPAVLIGISHSPLGPLGQLVVCTVQDIGEADLAGMLRAAASMLELKERML
jgi:hypothetical protein